MAQILEKRTADSATYDIICTGLLKDGETIASVLSIADDAGVLTYGVPVVNVAAVAYPNGVTAPAGTVVQVPISGGAIPAGSDSRQLGVPNYLCTVRCKVITNLSPTLDATVLLLLQDEPI